MTGPPKTIEPVTTLFDDGKFLRILTELPGIAEEKIRVDLENSSTLVTIVAADTVVQVQKRDHPPLRRKIQQETVFQRGP